jgi:hypothetical protein
MCSVTREKSKTMTMECTGDETHVQAVIVLLIAHIDEGLLQTPIYLSHVFGQLSPCKACFYLDFLSVQSAICCSSIPSGGNRISTRAESRNDWKHMCEREREYCTTVSAANTDPRVSCVRPVCACCLLWGSRSGTQSGTQAEAGLDATRLQANDWKQARLQEMIGSICVHKTLWIPLGLISSMVIGDV